MTAEDTTGARRRVADDPKWSAGSPVLHPSGTMVACVRLRIDEHGLGRTHLHHVDLDTGQGRYVAVH